MVDNCKHVIKVNPARDHSILNPQKWLCNVCGTTESVWACLSCSHVACGRYNEEHALNHFNEAKHPLALEVNDKYVFCYECDDYVLNDNAAGDIRLLRSALSAIATQSFTDLESRGKRILRSRTFSGFGSRTANHLLNQDKSYTALLHRRLKLLGRAFYTWRDNVWEKRPPPKPKPKPVVIRPPLVRKVPPPPKTPSPSNGANKKKRTMIPGVVGLRNLGNTCYMNAILQVLSSMDEFRQHFLNSDPTASNLSNRRSSTASTTSPGTVRQSPRLLQRQTTMECFEQVHSPLEGCIHKKGGLNGGGSGQSKAIQLAKLRQGAGVQSLSHELHALFRVMWSGKWGIVSPHSMLHAVWNIIPFFKGYSQQDAQEFLTELLDKVENEMQNAKSVQSRRLLQLANNLVTETFQGQLVSQVKCLACGNISKTYEPFYDLSLEFPDRYQISGTYKVVSQESCNLTEMLAKFTEVEKLEEKIYACENCNSKRRRASHKPLVRTEAEKTFMINKLPKVIRLHLKRFRWSGRNHREKINTHVDFDEELDLSPFCSKAEDGPFLYQLSAVVIHHGRGFSSGHYTAFCWNDEASSWVHCNDARVELCKIKEVTKSQAYILLYTRKNESVQFEELAQALNTPPVDDDESDDEVILNIKNEESEQTEVVQNVLSTMCSIGEGDSQSGGIQHHISVTTDNAISTGPILEQLIGETEMVAGREGRCDSDSDTVPVMNSDSGAVFTQNFGEHSGNDRSVLLGGTLGPVGILQMPAVVPSTPEKVVTSPLESPERLRRFPIIVETPPDTLEIAENIFVATHSSRSPVRSSPTAKVVGRSPEKPKSPIRSILTSEQFSSPVSVEKLPKTPEKMGEKTLKSPEKIARAAEKLVKTLEKVCKTPEKIVKTPEKCGKTPEIGLSSPEECVEISEIGDKTPEKVLKTPEKGVYTPEKRVYTPEKGVTPERGVETPDKVVKVPEKGVKTPETGVTLPEKGVETPEKTLKTPEKVSIKTPEKVKSPMKASETHDQTPEELQSPEKTLAKSPSRISHSFETAVMSREASRKRARGDSQSDSECEKSAPPSVVSASVMSGHLMSTGVTKRSAEAEDLPGRPHKRRRTTTL